MKFISSLFVIGFGLSAGNVFAGDDFAYSARLSSTQAKELTQDLGAAYSFKAIDTAATGGLLGVSVGVSTHFTNIKNTDTYKVANGNSSTTAFTTRIVAEKGIPGGFALAGSVAKLPSGSLIGVQGKYQLMSDTVATPAVSIRANINKSLDANYIDFSGIGLEALVSKSFVVVTPYAGMGVHQSRLDIKNSSAGAQSETQLRTFAGVQASLGIVDVGLEVENFGKTQVASLRFSVGF